MDLTEHGCQIDCKRVSIDRKDKDCSGTKVFSLADHPSIKRKGASKCPYSVYEFYQGPVGVTHYKIEGPEDGELTIAFHGLNGTRATWQGTAKDLVNIGYRVLSYDLFGHGLSENPSPDLFTGYAYTLQFFVDQLDALLVHLKLQHQPCNLLGFSLGALVAVAFACKYTDRILRIVLVAPAGALERKPKSVRAIEACQCFIPCSSGCICRCCLSKKSFLTRCSDEDKATGAAEAMWNGVVWTMFEKRKTIPSFLTMVTRLPIWSAEHMYTRISQIPIMLIWGQQDNVIPLHTSEVLTGELDNCHLITFPRATHQILSERLNECTALIATFLDFPASCHLTELQFLLPYTPDGQYKLPRDRKPADLSQDDYFDVIGYKPKRWFKVKDAGPGGKADDRDRKQQRKAKKAAAKLAAAAAASNFNTSDQFSGDDGNSRTANAAQPPDIEVPNTPIGGAHNNQPSGQN